jgi:hypothetical protein
MQDLLRTICAVAVGAVCLLIVPGDSSPAQVTSCSHLHQGSCAGTRFTRVTQSRFITALSHNIFTWSSGPTSMTIQKAATSGS